MKQQSKSNVFWIFIGILIGIGISLVFSQFMMKEMAPIDNRHHDLEGILIASVIHNFSTSSQTRFFYKPENPIHVPERFTLQIEHDDFGIFIDPSLFKQEQVYVL